MEELNQKIKNRKITEKKDIKINIIHQKIIILRVNLLKIIKLIMIMNVII